VGVLWLLAGAAGATATAAVSPRFCSPP